MTSELLEKYIKIVQSQRKRPKELTVHEFAEKANISKERAKIILDGWVSEGLWGNRDVSLGKRIVTYYEPLE
jgi:hypothetical protein